MQTNQEQDHADDVHRVEEVLTVWLSRLRDYVPEDQRDLWRRCGEARIRRTTKEEQS